MKYLQVNGDVSGVTERKLKHELHELMYYKLILHMRWETNMLVERSFSIYFLKKVSFLLTRNNR